MQQQNNLIPFYFQQKPVRVVFVEGEPWWIAKDVCDVLGLSNPTEAVRALDDDEKDILRISEGIGNPDKVVFSESGLYTLILRSSKPEAKAFRRWITHEVLPQIRRTGSYSLPQQAAFALPPEETALLRAVSAILPKTTMELRNIAERLSEFTEDKWVETGDAAVQVIYADYIRLRRIARKLRLKTAQRFTLSSIITMALDMYEENIKL